jgi:glycosyltransferase involved in cell wall biosynthesis
LRSNSSRVAVVIPALNCETTIFEVVAQARRVLPDIFVVDDGSSDATARLAADAGAEVLRHAQTEGKGAALLTGLDELARRGFERMLTMDGDGQHLADQMPLLLAASDRAPEALIIGARIMEGVPTTAARLFGNRFANRWVEIACGCELPDTQSGFRVYPVQRTLALKVRSRRFAFETEVLIRAVRAGVALESVPTRVFYAPADVRISHFRPVVDTVRIIFVVLGLIFRIW